MKVHYLLMLLAAACFAASNSLQKAEHYVALHQYQQANEEFRMADKEQPNSAIVKTAWGNLFLRNAQPQDAAKLFQEAMQCDPNFAPAYLGLSRALAEGFDKNAVDLAQAALHHDPKYYPAHEFLAYLALEDGDRQLAEAEAHKALALSTQALDGMTILASLDALAGSTSTSWMDQVLKVDPVHGEAYATLAHFFEINYRYDEAIAAYRKAIALSPDLQTARSQLGVNLMRIGHTEEARKELEQCFQAHFRNAETVNSLRFLDTVKQYERFTTDSADVLINRSEAALLRPYVERELRRAIETYERKYHITVPGRIRLEVYPNHEDFIVRTLGLPGQGALLGVTFGSVVAIDSPSARTAGDFSWADTMWHELCHVYVINATHQLVPRWFSEGLAVHEEGVVSPRWGNRLTPDTIAAIKQKKLLPVLELDAGFVRPKYSGQVLVSYYQAGQICDYIAERWGDAALLGMIHSYAARKTTQDALQDNLHESPDTFDKTFAAWLDKKTGSVMAHFDQWKNGMKSASVAFEAGNAAKALESLAAIRDFYPDSPATYDVLAKCYLALSDKPQAMHALELYQDRGGLGIPQLKQLAQLDAGAGHPEKAISTLEEINLIYPEDQESHQQLGGLLLKASRTTEAIEEYRAVLALKPADVAASHFDLARALNAAHQTAEAKDQVLLALEAAPDFKPAQQLLLQLSQ